MKVRSSIYSILAFLQIVSFAPIAVEAKQPKVILGRAAAMRDGLDMIEFKSRLGS